MLRELKFTLRFSDHIKNVTLKHFEFRFLNLAYEIKQDDFDSYRAYFKDLLIDKPTYSDFTQHQKYLHNLEGLIGIVISSYRVKTRIPRLRPRTKSIMASAKLEESGQRLSFEAYHFKERMKLFSRSTAALISNEPSKIEFGRKIGRVVSEFEQINGRLLRYRNFVVHGPDKRVDEFASLRSWELGGIFHHPDLWFDYNTAFAEAQQDWKDLAKTLISSMEKAIFQIQLLNENLIENRTIDFIDSSSLNSRNEVGEECP